MSIKHYKHCEGVIADFLLTTCTCQYDDLHAMSLDIAKTQRKGSNMLRLHYIMCDGKFMYATRAMWKCVQPFNHTQCMWPKIVVRCPKIVMQVTFTS